MLRQCPCVPTLTGQLTGEHCPVVPLQLLIGADVALPGDKGIHARSSSDTLRYHRLDFTVEDLHHGRYTENVAHGALVEARHTDRRRQEPPLSCWRLLTAWQWLRHPHSRLPTSVLVLMNLEGGYCLRKPQHVAYMNPPWRAAASPAQYDHSSACYMYNTFFPQQVYFLPFLFCTQISVCVALPHLVFISTSYISTQRNNSCGFLLLHTNFSAQKAAALIHLLCGTRSKGCYEWAFAPEVNVITLMHIYSH